MKTYSAIVFASDGIQQSFPIKGNSTETVRSYLHTQGFTIQSLIELPDHSLWARFQKMEFGQRISPQNRIRFLRTLGQMMERGYPIEKVLDFLLADEYQKDVRRLLLCLQKKVRSGYTDFVELFRVVEGYFDEEFFSLLIAGQRTGTVGQNIVDYAEGKDQIFQQKQALFRVLSGKFLLFAIVLAAFLVIVLFVVPQFQALFGEKLELPLGMKIMVGLSHLFLNYGLWLLVGGVLLSLLFGGFYSFHLPSRKFVQHVLLRIPVSGYLMRMFHTRNFLYLMGNLLTKGVSLMEVMRIVVDQSRNLCFQSVYKAVKKNLERGRKLEDVLRPFDESLVSSGHFVSVPPGYLLESVAQAMTLGSKGGNLGEMLTEAYLSYDIQLQERMSLAIRILSVFVSMFAYSVILFMIGSLALTLFRVMEDPTVFM